MDEPKIKIVDAREESTRLFTLVVMVRWPDARKPLNFWLQAGPQLMFGLSWFEGVTTGGKPYWSARLAFAMFNFSVSRDK